MSVVSRARHESFRVARHLANLVSGMLPDDALSRRLRPVLWRRLGCAIGENVRMLGGSQILGKGLTIGPNSFISRNCYFDLTAPIILRSDVVIGHGAVFITAEHGIGPSRRRCSDTVVGREIRVGRGVWIGANAIILPGVIVNDGAVVAAGAVVTADVERDCLVGGSPARTIRKLPA
jgi:acetyltransferase-like isoleucine patch superfamily enzyme